MKRLDPQAVKALFEATLSTRPTELTCDEWLEAVARYAELRARGEEIPKEMDLVAQHVEICPECNEELEALLELLEG